jgi:hypothetical protein
MHTYAGFSTTMFRGVPFLKARINMDGVFSVNDGSNQVNRGEAVRLIPGSFPLLTRSQIKLRCKNPETGISSFVRRSTGSLATTEVEA